MVKSSLYLCSVDGYTAAGCGTFESPEEYEADAFRYVHLKIEAADEPLTVLSFRYRAMGYTLEEKTRFTVSDSDKRSQKLRPFRKIDDSFRKILVVGDIVPKTYDEYGILTVNVYDRGRLLDPSIIEG